MTSNIERIKKLVGMSYNSDVAIVTITPAIAEELLKYNTHNRPRQERRIKEYIADMQKGKWVLSESAIGFDKDGVLTNGQTRLEACVKSGKSFQTILCTVLEQNIHMDTGNVRRVIDNIILNGDADELICVNRVSLSTVCDVLRIIGHQRVTPEPVIEFCQKYGKYIDNAYNNGLLINTGNVSGLFKVSIASAFLVACINDVDLSLLMHIREVLTTGITTDEKDTIIIRWRDKLISMNGSGTTACKKMLYYGTQDLIHTLEHNKKRKIVKTDTEWYPVF